MAVQSLAAKSRPKDIGTGIKAEDRRKVADGLRSILGDTYLLLIKTHAYHWNVVGPLFKPIHEMTESQYEDLFAASDVIAERIRALGHLAPVSFAAFDKMASLQEEKGNELTAHEMVDRLACDHDTHQQDDDRIGHRHNHFQCRTVKKHRH